ncbi:hypothetical protein RCH10_004981, partial [Variovorax sp. GrIS 2.14]
MPPGGVQRTVSAGRPQREFSVLPQSRPVIHKFTPPHFSELRSKFNMAKIIGIDLGT